VSLNSLSEILDEAKRWRYKIVPRQGVVPTISFLAICEIRANTRSTHSQILRAPLPSSPSLASLPFTPTPSILETHYTSETPTGEVNRFKVRAGQSLQEWEKAGWIWAGDPRGWAEWYCRFWGGRRCGDDERQVRRCRSSPFSFTCSHSD
jgi:hypothetical protein